MVLTNHTLAFALVLVCHLAGCTYVCVTTDDVNIQGTVKLQGGDDMAVPKADQDNSLADGTKHPILD